MLDNPFWEYSLAHYGRREVAESCLSLQDSRGANVNLLLFCCWLGCRGERLTSEKLVEAQLLISDWDRQVVQPLRQIRRFLKQSADTTAQILEVVSTLELKAERVAQDRLASWWLKGDARAEKKGAAASAVVGLQQHNLAIYLTLLHAPLPAIHSPLFWPL